MTPTRKKNGIAIEAMYTASYVAGSDVAKIGSIALDSESLCSHLRDSDLSLPAPIRLTEQTFTRHLSNKPKYQHLPDRHYNYSEAKYVELSSLLANTPLLTALFKHISTYATYYLLHIQYNFVSESRERKVETDACFAHHSSLLTAHKDSLSLHPRRTNTKGPFSHLTSSV
ncbi:hypothetical protein SNK03_007996 [Fusarium graminearum]|uniref:Chromosome 4, complete genome n=1 Tax=Gibberella zeae (strain ATCC MYA-4620 / CBS 123657 / FGSC 9075 / NRRL 31084 / PH-1) TaxID=229533 RepID=I1S7Z4_GIBZE|nr:hypothetical protein FGSG_12969 [Fusarium graminearum PH-1]ESU12840.1 hypothetical protein FGSG_12969 [Fusarium graminearum PH-1]EYB28252.1 hypothetical protein FG05_12969 [Fusarium graminearum]CEF82779.1 unnamed protein product [Fusarium graminearum]CZS72406.1 unnamed protein product [Fusarium graminearum]|eukprot:XP_011326347.1 hypothetical protein FGSG_12969 [Fusarium graminearum PH-1]